MGTELAKNGAPKALVTLADHLESRKGDLARLVPKHLNLDRLMKLAMASMERSQKLRECDLASVVQCVMTCAELGLEPGGALGGAYLVPFKGHCKLVIGYRGYIDLMRRSGKVSLVEAVVVYAKDRFRYSRGLNPVLEHEPYIDGAPGPMLRVYCVVTMADGAKQFEVLSKAQVDAIRARAPSSSDGPWVTDYDEMAKKTAVRRVAKLCPMSTEMARAIEAEDEPYIDGEIVEQVAPSLTNPAEAALKARLATVQEAKPSPPRPSEPTPWDRLVELAKANGVSWKKAAEWLKTNRGVLTPKSVTDADFEAYKLALASEPPAAPVATEQAPSAADDVPF